MSDHELEKIKMRKAEALLKLQANPTEIVEIHSYEELAQLSKDYPDKRIIIDFWAIWCGPCKVFGPIFEQLQKEYHRDFIFCKINIDENRELAIEYRVSSIPTTLFLRNGKTLSKIVGTLSYNSFKAVLEKLKG